MNTKKLSVILIAIAFTLVALFSCIGLLTVKEVRVTFAVAENTDSQAIQNELDKNIGKNLLFLTEEEVIESLKGNHYLEVLSVDKQYPNVINVSIKERREVYLIEHGGKTYVTNEDGFVLSDNALPTQTRNKIKLELGQGVNFSQIQPGSIIKTDNDELLSAVFEMAKSVRLTDCIESIKIDLQLGEIDKYDVTFNAYTGVALCVWDVLDMGQEKVVNAFRAYDELLTDYQKNSGLIASFVTYEGVFRVTYNNEHILTVNP